MAPTTSHLFTGLNPASSYRARVLANCTSPASNTSPTPGSSPWSLTTATFVPNSREAHGLAVAGDGEIVVYPNPNRGSFGVRIPSASDTLAELRLSDVLGRTIWRSQTELLQGTNDVNVEVKAAAGVYALTIRRAETTQTVKITLE
jgi:hypothetical protein